MPHRPFPVRRATRDDLDSLVALEESTFSCDRISRAQWRRHIESASVSVLVAGKPGDIEGAAVVFYRRRAHAARLYSIAVGAHARGTGLGGALLDAAEQDVRARGFGAVQLEVRTDNASAIALYERRDYRGRTRIPGFYEDGADAWRYVKRLANP